MNRLILCGLVLLSFGCTPEQPWSYAPCYARNELATWEFIDCPDISTDWKMEPTEELADGARIYALFTIPVWHDLVPHIMKWRDE